MPSTSFQFLCSFLSSLLLISEFSPSLILTFVLIALSNCKNKTPLAVEAGQDWLLSIMQWIPDEEVEAALNAAWALKRVGAHLRECLQAGEVLLQQTQFLEQRGLLHSTLTAKLCLHRQLPVGLGSANKGFEQVARALIHKLSCEFDYDVNAMLQRVVGLCTDMGEIELSDISLKTDQCTPFWTHRAATLHREAETESPWPLLALTPEVSEYLFPFCLPSPGLGHVWSNLMSDLDHTIKGGEAWLTQWHALAPLLSRPHLHKRFIAACVMDGPFQSLRTTLERCLMPNLPVWRWGAIFNILDRLLPLQGPLRATMVSSQIRIIRKDHYICTARRTCPTKS